MCEGKSEQLTRVASLLLWISLLFILLLLNQLGWAARPFICWAIFFLNCSVFRVPLCALVDVSQLLLVCTMSFHHFIRIFQRTIFLIDILHVFIFSFYTLCFWYTFLGVLFSKGFIFVCPFWVSFSWTYQIKVRFCLSPRGCPFAVPL